MGYGRLAAKACSGRARTQTPRHTYLHAAKFSRGWVSSTRSPPAIPAEQPDEEYPLILTTGRCCITIHSGTMTRRSKALDWRERKATSGQRPTRCIDLQDNFAVVIKSRRGTVRTRARISDDVRRVRFSWRSLARAPANMLTQDFALDRRQDSEYKVCARAPGKSRADARNSGNAPRPEPARRW